LRLTSYCFATKVNTTSLIDKYLEQDANTTNIESAKMTVIDRPSSVEYR